LTGFIQSSSRLRWKATSPIAACVSKTYSWEVDLKSGLHRILKLGLILADHPLHARKLVEPPFAGAGCPGSEERLLRCENGLI